MEHYGQFTIREESFGWGEFAHNESTEILVYNSGRWSYRTIQCWSSVVFGGTCHCNSHDAFEETPLTRREAQEIVVSNNLHLSEEWSSEMAEDLECIGLPQWDLEEVLHLRDLTFTRLEDWVRVAYELDVNPLPGIRKMLKDAGIDIVVSKDSSVYLILETKKGEYLDREDFGEEENSNPLPY